MKHFANFAKSPEMSRRRRKKYSKIKYLGGQIEKLQFRKISRNAAAAEDKIFKKEIFRRSIRKNYRISRKFRKARGGGGKVSLNKYFADKFEKLREFPEISGNVAAAVELIVKKNYFTDQLEKVLWDSAEIREFRDVVVARDVREKT